MPPGWAKLAAPTRPECLREFCAEIQKTILALKGAPGSKPQTSCSGQRELAHVALIVVT